MCIICSSAAGVRQPTYGTIRTMFENNPHGAGYMYARNGKVHIRKGFMDVDSFLDAIRKEHFTAKDPVVYHFRISTQAGVQPEMTHPFPLSNRRDRMKVLKSNCRCGIAHNGTIQLTSDPSNKEYSDTALFVTQYLSEIIRQPSDLRNPATLDFIHHLAGSKFAIMDASGYIATIGKFINERGLLFSNDSYHEYRYRWQLPAKRS